MFSTPIIKLMSSDGHIMTVAEPFTYTTLKGEIITVPIGAQTDGLSIPEFFWNIAPPFGVYWMAGVLHDYLYRYTEVEKSYADDIFLEAMISLGTPKVLADMIYHGVKYGGWKAFDTDRANKEKLLS